MRRVFETPNSLVSELPRPSVDRVSESFVFEMPIFKFPSLHHHWFVRLEFRIRADSSNSDGLVDSSILKESVGELVAAQMV